MEKGSHFAGVWSDYFVHIPIDLSNVNLGIHIHLFNLAYLLIVCNLCNVNFRFGDLLYASCYDNR